MFVNQKILIILILFLFIIGIYVIILKNEVKIQNTGQEQTANIHSAQPNENGISKRKKLQALIIQKKKQKK